MRAKLIKTATHSIAWLSSGVFFLSFIVDICILFSSKDVVLVRCAGVAGALLTSLSINILLLNAVPIIMGFGVNQTIKNLDIPLFTSMIGVGVIIVSISLGFKILLLSLICPTIFAIMIVFLEMMNRLDSKVFFEQLKESTVKYISLEK